MKESPSLSDFKEYMTFLQGCCLKHPIDYEVSKIIAVDSWVQSIPDEASGGAIFKLDDDRWGAMEESQDYTGHG